MTSTSRCSRRLVGAGLIGLVLAVEALPASYADDDKPRTVFTITSPQITESSSLVVSTAHPGLVYTTNDSGDDATVYVLDATAGDVVGRTTLTGVDPVDIEALSGGSDGSLIVADIGDNHAERASVTIYRVDQPSRGDREVRADETELSYLGGPRDAESVLYDAETGRAFVVSKEFRGAQVFESGTDVFARPRSQLRPIASAVPLATDATFLTDDGLAVVRNYFNAVMYTYPGWDAVASVELPAQDQGESVATPLDGDVIWIGSEGQRSKVLEIPLPALTKDNTPGLEPSPSVSPSPSPSPDTIAPAPGEHSSPANPQLETLARIVLVVAITALLLVGAAVLFTRRYHRSSS